MSEVPAIRQAKPPVPINSGKLIPPDVESAFRLAEMLWRGGALPKGVTEPAQVLRIITFGMEIGLGPSQSLNVLALINGKVCLWGDGLPALVHASGQLESMEEKWDGDGDGYGCTVTVHRRNVAATVSRTFTVGDAKAARLWKKSGPWTDYPERMLLIRARAFAFRDMFADVLGGLGVVEEVDDYGQPRFVINTDALDESKPAPLGTLPMPDAEQEAAPAEPLPMELAIDAAMSKSTPTHRPGA